MVKEFVVTVCKGANWGVGLMAGGVMTGSVYNIWMKAAKKRGLESDFGIRTAGYGVAGLAGTLAGSAITGALNRAVENTFEKKTSDD